MASPPDAPSAGTLDHTADLLENGVTALSPAAATGVIDRWISAIGETGNEALIGGVGGSLGGLRAALLDKPLDGARIGPLLVTLGRQTTEASAEAGEGLRASLERLGRLLSSAGQALGADDTPDYAAPAFQQPGTQDDAPEGAVQQASTLGSQSGRTNSGAPAQKTISPNR